MNIENSININNLFENYDIFIKNINIELDYKLIILNLKININKIQEDINDILLNFNNILLLDVENILKSAKIQNILKLYIDNDKFNNIFKKWLNGEILVNDNLSNTSYIEPYKTLNINIESKIELMNILITNYLDNYDIILIFNSKEFYQKKFYKIKNSNIWLYSIKYTKIDIREQDDHLLLFLYFYLNKFKTNLNLISSDKFKWYKGELIIYDLILIYNFDIKNISIQIDKAYTNDFIIYNNNKYYLKYYYSPIFNLNKFYKIDKIYEITNNLADYNIILNLFLWIIDYTSENNLSELLCYLNSLNNNLDNIIKLSLKITVNLKFIFKELSKYSLKNLNIKLLSNNLYFNNNMNELKDNFKIYNNICNIYILFKFIIIEIYFKINVNESNIINFKIYYNLVIKISKLYSIIIEFYDLINDNINKIRKLSYDDNNISLFFLNINQFYINLKKKGFCKTNYF